MPPLTQKPSMIYIKTRRKWTMLKGNTLKNCYKLALRGVQGKKVNLEGFRETKSMYHWSLNWWGRYNVK